MANLTKQRRAVLEVVKESHDHPTAADIMDRLREKDYKFAYATVYNSLKYLVEQGLIQELHITNGVSRYDGRMEEHHHAVCDKCGKMVEVLTELPEDFLQRVVAETGFEIHHHHLIFHGLCADCKSSAGRTPS
ncbi:transcriptional repressor [Alicyclobacillus contaminans]|uniref:Fur family transcriptional regulator n=1 Tax=Alicyclobacillus contaminans TaxID=392016 RepID=UPI000410684D|nr:transcriptional repressor [Alicyclobacillus contaminans]GMA50082.1 transcriptional repressor [Alicyclobacillus contaminans]